jgi:pyridinium-3,5-bisthiocarboxylic acid mononucleotide nickel chelatase
MRIGYLECFSGISGDMLLGALVDAGVPLALLEETTVVLNLGARLEMRKVIRGGLTGTKVDVIVDDATKHDHVQASANHEQEHDAHSHEHTHDHGHSHEHTHADGKVHTHDHDHQPHRSLSTILRIIADAPLTVDVKSRASLAFHLLGEAEAKIHSMPIEKVHFHEVGAIDTIVDIVCSAVGCAHLGVDRWLASPLNVGSGTVECAHGTLPVPAPAALALLGDAPVYASGPPMERVTPTGAAVLRMLNVEYASLPAMRISTSGYGAGGRDTPGQPNLLRMLVGEETAGHSAAEQIAILETVIDDSSPQLIAYVSEVLLEAGAWDVYRIPVQMKKGRTGVQLTVLCHPDKVPALRDLLFRETTTIGLHWRIENKVSLARDFKEVQTEWGLVRIKIARWPSGEVANAAPEYEDCRRIASAHSVPLKAVTQQALRIFAAIREESRQ